MKGPEPPRLVLTDWGKFVTREATAPLHHHHKFGALFIKGGVSYGATMLYEYRNGDL